MSRILSRVGTFNSEIDQLGETDNLVVSLTEGEFYIVRVARNISGNITLETPFLTGRDAGGFGNTTDPQLLSFSTTGLFNDDTELRDPIAVFRAPSTDDYAFGVGEEGGDDTGAYQLIIDRVEMLPVTTPVEIRGSLDEPYEIDVFATNLTEGTEYQAAVQGQPTGGGSLPNPVLNLFRPGSPSVSFSNDSNDSLGEDPFLQFVAPESGTYLIAVTDFAGFEGDYQLRFDEVQFGDIA
jgi:hypothetical protein